jgi:ArsR family transcriptional regulator
MNMKKRARSISRILKAISAAPRIRILLGIGEGQACVCHLEAILGWRQAYISQHLMALRKADILASRREGRFIYYSLQDPRILELLETAAELAGVQLSSVPAAEDCGCPSCNPSEALIPVESF